VVIIIICVCKRECKANASRLTHVLSTAYKILSQRACALHIVSKKTHFVSSKSMNRNEIILLDTLASLVISFLNALHIEKGIIMFNRTCMHCGSRFTYAVPSRAKNKVTEDGRLVADEQGLAVKVMCRRCRNCGIDYFEDERLTNRPPTEVEQKMLEEVRKYREEKEKKKLQ
jgi:hypothetical protein